MTMSKTYQIKTVDAKGQALLETIQASTGKPPVTLKALPGVRYTLMDVQQGSAPDNIRVQRTGKHLKILFDGSKQTDLVLENYFDRETGQPPSLAGATDSGALHEYIPETGREQDSLPQLEDNSAIQGMALGGAELPIHNGAAVGLLAPVAGGGLGLGTAGAGLLGAAAIGASGGGSPPAKPSVTSLALASASDSGPSGDNITNFANLKEGQKAQVTGKATPGSVVKVTSLNGSFSREATADDNGNFSIDLSSDLNPGQYKLQAVATKNGVSSDTYTGIPFFIDTSSGDNYDNNGHVVSDANSDATLTELSLSDDSGPSGDLMTSAQHQQFTGTLSHYANNGDQVLITLSKLGDSSFQSLSAYLTPNAQGQWTWDQSALTLTAGKYELKSVLVDGAGNDIHNASNQAIVRSDTITISAGHGKVVNPDGSVSDDPNSTDRASALIGSLSNDTGTNATDFITSDNTLVFKGLLEHYTHNGDMVKVQLKNSTGAVVQTDHLHPTGNEWNWDLSALKLNDGQYELFTTIVDAGGTQVSGTTTTSQKLAIDTRASTNQSLTAQTDDANSALTLQWTSMTDTDDGHHASTNQDKVTNSTTPVFNGHFGSGQNWTDNGDTFQLQVFNPAGTPVLSQHAVVSDGNHWTSDTWTTPLSDGIYIAKASIMDIAGNVLGTVQQAFAVDHTTPSLQFSESVKDIALEGSAFSNGLTVTRFSLSSNEAVHYTIKSGTTVLAEGDYNGLASATPLNINGSFAAGAFTVVYTDAAGNTSSYSNDSKLIFDNIAVNTSAPSHGYTPPATPLDKLNAIGTIQLTAANPALDLTSAIDRAGSLHNHIDMSAASAQHLTLNLNDVLNLGAVNSFRLDGLLQMRVDGDNRDSVVFKDRAAWEVATSTVDIGTNHYTLYSSHDAHGALVEVLVQQGIQVS